jgi:hypothetical protein
MKNYDNDASCKTAEPIRRTPPIADSLDTLDKFLEMTSCTLARLEDRLTPVLSPVPPNASVGEDGAPTPCVSPVARTIGEANVHVDRLNARIQTLLDRTEL